MLHQLWTGRQIPVGIPHIGVAEIGGQGGQQPFDIFAGAIPVEQRLNGESMSEIMDTRPIALARLSESDLS